MGQGSAAANNGAPADSHPDESRDIGRDERLHAEGCPQLEARREVRGVLRQEAEGDGRAPAEDGVFDRVDGKCDGDSRDFDGAGPGHGNFLGEPVPPPDMAPCSELERAFE